MYSRRPSIEIFEPADRSQITTSACISPSIRPSINNQTMGNDFIGDLHSLAGAPSPGTLPVVSVYTDGDCSPNPGFGGWGAVLISPAHSNARRELSGAEAN